MKLWMRLLAQMGPTLVLTASLTPGYAAEAHMHRCVNANGRVYYTDLPGKECAEGRHDRLTRDGLVLDRPEVEVEKEAAATAAAAEQKSKLLAQNRYDRTLLATYASEEQIEIAKQARLKTPKTALEWSMRKLVIYSNRMADLKEREAELTGSNASVPDLLKEDIEMTKSDIARIEKEVHSKQLSIDEIVQSFDLDKQRYRELTVPTKNN